MLETTLKVRNPLGLHARAAAQLVRLANKFKSRIILKRADNTAYANAKSILSVLTLAASAGTLLILNVDGEDQDKAFEAIVAIFNSGFGEI